MRFFSLLSISFIAITLSASMVSAEPLLKMIPTLTLDIAKKIAGVCESRQLNNKNAPVTIAIYDQGANLILFHRMTGASLGTGEVAMQKGKSAAYFPVATKHWAKAAYGKNGSPGIAELPHIVTLAGGVPIVTTAGVHLGGIGVSGSSGEEDETCALAGIDAVANDLSLPR